MDYLYENLGDEQFQEFCHCLLSNEFENMQAFPVGQPDGGRDSIAYVFDSSKREFIVFQVKYVRNPKQERDIHKWLVATIEGEITKIKRLIERGAKSYYLITNVKGTAHLDVGAIDKLQKILDDNIDIPSFCWWRDDLSRKIETNPLIKWSFPQILSGQDILNSILFENITKAKERRQSVIQAYLADQYEMDNEVKFKQIELQNRLLDLFVDVPIQIKKYNHKNKKFRKILYRFRNLDLFNEDHERLYAYQEENGIGAASFLLNQLVQKDIHKIVLEGGPGQGKSTIAQYICQIHRIRLLNKKEDFNSIPNDFLKVPVRLPFKIDLRDIATWMEFKNPYSGILSEEYFSKIWAKSLESFLVAHICYHSNLFEFNSNDLVSIFKLSSILIVLDGFDEIADLELREEIITFVKKGVNRLTQNSKSIQIIITSRPAALSSSVGFPVDEYPNFELTDITLQNIRQYVDKWIKAKRLNSREASEIKRLVDEKLELPHLRSLAKSPMQLAILISLLNTRGESLPNKRTALYDSYIELFFNRESEKNITIRDNRDLIIDIHKYLAWILHSEAEMYKNSGKIEINQLKDQLKDYLKKEGHKTNIADQLFTVMEERVCALVSRVQGTFEFEVQPLREYFCAKYLYETSPYSPAGCESTGTKPERFEAISRNFYWQNVVRFFAGCFDKGELPMLIHKLGELQNDEFLKHTNYPRIVTAQLLSDWVFTQYPVLLKNVLKIIIDGLNIGDILNQNFEGSNNESILLPEECGRKELVEECFNQLKKFPNIDYAYELIGLITENPYHLKKYWEEHVEQVNEEELSIWLEYAYLLGILHLVDKKILVSILNQNPLEHLNRLQIILNAKQGSQLIQNDFLLKKTVLKGILSGELVFTPEKSELNALSSLNLYLNTFVLSYILRVEEENSSFLDYIHQRTRYYYVDNEALLNFDVKDQVDEKIRDFFDKNNKTFDTDISVWKRKIEPWDRLVETGRTILEDNWLFNLISIVSAGIKSKEERCDQYSNLCDSNQSLCKRVRHARLKSGNIKWWEKELKNSKQIIFSLLVFFTWATPKTINQLLPIANQKVKSLDEDEFKKLIASQKQIAEVSTFKPVQQRFIRAMIKSQKVSSSIKYILSLRFPLHQKQQFIFENIKNYSGDIEDILQSQMEHLINEFMLNPVNDLNLQNIKEVYVKLKSFKEAKIRKYNLYFRYHMYPYEKGFDIPYEIAKNIMEDCKRYPRLIVFLSEKVCRTNANKKLIPVGEIAQKEGWFDICQIAE
ncbi:hypothetical protein [Desulfobacula sp.]|uniref:NACHT domain-containing protein n=1 Tax=Desulfobacula sp. TaxID=2593537 RepID=UPI00262367D6|nr:hypothetical protein [Desulfobacula sp.]